MRLFWIPPEARRATAPTCAIRSTSCSRILALESQRHRCLVIGEDLGTVPEACASAAPRGVLSYRLLYFERDGGRRISSRPRDYPRERWSAVSTHDLPTLAGWWSAHDLQTRANSA